MPYHRAMEEMGEDEVMALMASVVAGAFGLRAWYGPGFFVTRMGCVGWARNALLLVPLLALAGLWNVLVTAAAFDVTSDIRYQLLFLAMGTSWVFHFPRALSFIGVSYRDDALERRNGAAAVAVAGGVIGLGALFAGSNMGEGPSIWNTVETALVATGVLAFCVLVLAMITGIGDTIAVERDLAAGVRFGAWMAGSGLVLAAASAGDWAGEAAMVSDLLANGWPVALLLAAAIGLELSLRPTIESPRPAVIVKGLVPASAYLGSSVAYVALLLGHGV